MTSWKSGTVYSDEKISWHIANISGPEWVMLVVDIDKIIDALCESSSCGLCHSNTRPKFIFKVNDGVILEGACSKS